jgi:DNA processing protein
VFRASLTELESTGIQFVSAQWLAAGKSSELAREEIAQAAAADVPLLSMDHPSYPPRLKEIYDPPLILRARGNPEALTRPGVAMVGSAIPRLTAPAWPSGWLLISPRKGWSASVAWREV